MPLHKTSSSRTRLVANDALSNAPETASPDLFDFRRTDAAPRLDGHDAETSGIKHKESRAPRRKRSLSFKADAPAPAAPEEVTSQQRAGASPEVHIEWTEVKALNSKLIDSLTPFSNLEMLSAARQHPSIAAPGPVPRQDAPKGRKKLTSSGNEDSLQQSWDSLTYFERKSRSRLAQAGAAVLGGGTAATSSSHDPPHGNNPHFSATAGVNSVPPFTAGAHLSALAAEYTPHLSTTFQAKNGGHPSSVLAVDVKATDYHTDSVTSQFRSLVDSIEDSENVSKPRSNRGPSPTTGRNKRV